MHPVHFLFLEIYWITSVFIILSPLSAQCSFFYPRTLLSIPVQSASLFFNTLIFILLFNSYLLLATKEYVVGSRAMVRVHIFQQHEKSQLPFARINCSRTIVHSRAMLTFRMERRIIVEPIRRQYPLDLRQFRIMAMCRRAAATYLVPVSLFPCFYSTYL